MAVPLIRLMPIPAFMRDNSEAGNPTPRLFYGWWIVAAGFVVEILNGMLLFHGFTAYVLPLQREFKWSRTAVSGVFAMARAETGLLGPLQGWMTDRYGPRSMMLIGNALFGIGFILFSRVDSLPSFYASFAIIALGSSLGGFMPIATTVANWFFRSRATAMGISMAGMGAGGMFVPAVVWSLANYGWRSTAFFTGILIIAVGVPVSLVMRRRPEDYGTRPDGAMAAKRSPGDIPAPESAAGEPEFTLSQALHTPAFWLLSTSHGAALFVVGAVALHQIPHMVEGVGLREEEAAGIVTLLLGIQVGCQFLGGLIGDRMNKRRSIFLCMWIHTLAMCLFAFAESATGVGAFAILHGMAWGIRGPLVNSLRADYFGRKSFAQISGFASLIIMVGMTTGPLFAGLLYDHYGNYRVAFLILAGLTALGSIAVLFAHRPRVETASECNVA